MKRHDPGRAVVSRNAAFAARADVGRIPLMNTSSTLFASLLACALAVPGNGQAPAPPASPAGGVEILVAKVVDEMTDISGRVWRPAKPETDAALVITTRLARGAEYNTEDFTLGYGPAAKKQRAICAGHTARIPSGWVINEAGSKWSFYPGGTGTLDGLGILFVIPKDLTEATLYYKGKPVGAAFEVKRQ